MTSLRPLTFRPLTVGLLAALLCACAGRPSTPPPTPPIGAPSALVAWLEVRPSQLDARLTAFDARVGDQTALGPLGVALRRARAAVEDRLSDLAPGGATADAWSGWGVDGAAPLRIGLSAPDGPDLGRALLDALDGPQPDTSGRAVWRARIVATVTDEGRLRAGLDRLAARLGLTVAPLTTAEAESGPWRAHDASGLQLALTVRQTVDGRQAALDLALPAQPGATVDPLAGGEMPWPPNLDGPLAGGLVPAMLASLESGMQAAAALIRTADAGPRGRPVLMASAQVLTRCVERWQQAGSYSTAVVAALDAPDGRPRLQARVGLSPRGLRAWRAAVGPLPLASLDGLPAAIQAAMDPAPFAGLSPDWPAVIGCAAGHPLTVGLAGLGIVPGLARAERLPLPGPVSGWPAQTRGLAAALTGAVDIEGQAVPTLAGLVRVGPDHPVDPAPLGADTVQPTPEVHARPGPMPVTFGDHRNGDGRVLIFGLGPGAHGALIDRLAVDPQPGAALEGHADPSALAAVLAAAGEASGGVEALRALGARFGRLEVRAERVDDVVHWRLALAPTAADGGGVDAGSDAARELDHTPSPK